MNANLTIPLDDPEVAKHFEGCEVGDQKTLTFTVTQKDPTMLQGSIDEIEEGYAEETGDESGDEKPDAKAGAKKGHPGMPKGITLVIAGGG